MDSAAVLRYHDYNNKDKEKVEHSQLKETLATSWKQTEVSWVTFECFLLCLANLTTVITTVYYYYLPMRLFFKKRHHHIKS